jgi:hypothetical protein
LAITIRKICVHHYYVIQNVALSEAAEYFLWLKTAQKDLSIPKPPMALFCNNHSAIILAENYQIFELSKYIDNHHHHNRE